MNSIISYFLGFFQGIYSLMVGMSITLRELFTKKITEEYPENRATLVVSDRYKGSLTMLHNENNEHACNACGLCQMNCPNDTIFVESELTEIDGKKKKVLVNYTYNLGQCSFCNLCVLSCPTNAIEFDNSFENAVFTKSKLIEKLNREGSKLKEAI